MYYLVLLVVTMYFSEELSVIVSQTWTGIKNFFYLAQIYSHCLIATENMDYTNDFSLLFVFTFQC